MALLQRWRMYHIMKSHQVSSGEGIRKSRAAPFAAAAGAEPAVVLAAVVVSR